MRKWALLLGNTITLVSAMAYDRTVNAIGPSSCPNISGSRWSMERSR